MSLLLGGFVQGIDHSLPAIDVAMQSTGMRTAPLGAGHKVRCWATPQNERRTSFLVKTLLEGFQKVALLGPLPFLCH